MINQTCRQINGNSVRPTTTHNNGVNIADIGMVRFAVSTSDVRTDINVAGTCCQRRTNVRADRGILIPTRELTERVNAYGCLPVAVHMVSGHSL